MEDGKPDRCVDLMETPAEDYPALTAEVETETANTAAVPIDPVDRLPKPAAQCPSFEEQSRHSNIVIL